MSNIASELGKNIIQNFGQYKNDDNSKNDDSDKSEELNFESTSDDIHQNIEINDINKISKDVENNTKDVENNTMVNKIVSEENCVVIEPQKQQKVSNIKPTQMLPIKQTSVIKPISITKQNPIHIVKHINTQPVKQKVVRFDDTINNVKTPQKRNINPVQIINMSQSLFDKIKIEKSTILFLIIMILIGVGATTYQKFVLHK
jgi:ribosomal protein S15P/S13E